MFEGNALPETPAAVPEYQVSTRSGAALGSLADQIAQLGGQADRIATTAALEDAHQAGTASGDQDPAARATDGGLLYRTAFNRAAADSASRRLELDSRQRLTALEQEHATDPAAFAAAARAWRDGVAETLPPDVRTRFGQAFDSRALDLQGRIQINQRRQVADQALADFNALTEPRLAAATRAAGDPATAAAADREEQTFLTDLARNGPRDAFTLGGRQFPADPTRTEGLTLVQMQAQWQGFRSQVRENRVLGQWRAAGRSPEWIDRWEQAARSPNAGATGPGSLGLTRLLDTIERTESSGNPNAESGTSSASGAFQFTRDTWLAVVARNGGQRIAGLSREQILRLRFDRAFAREMAAAHIQQDLVPALTARGVEPSALAIYAGYHFGDGVAARIMTAPADRPMRDIVSPAAMEANGYLEGMTAGAWRDRYSRRFPPSAGLGVAVPADITPADAVQIANRMRQELVRERATLQAEQARAWADLQPLIQQNRVAIGVNGQPLHRITDDQYVAAGRDPAVERRQEEFLRQSYAAGQEVALSDLAEFHDALAEGRAWDAATPEIDPNADVAAWRPGEALPEDVAAAEARSAELAALGPTMVNRTPEREALADAWASEVAAARAAEVPGGVALERRALVVIGPPSAGKSTVIEPLARNMRALLIDPDDMKAKIPEFEGGVGAGRVHAESSHMAETVRQAAIHRGMNLAIPTVGDNAAKLHGLIEGLKAAGYHVTLVLNELPIDKAAQRNMVRFRETGRLVPVEYLMGIGNKPVESYMSLREIADAQAHYSNDVAQGEAPLHRGGTSLLQADDAPHAGTAGDVAAGSGPRPLHRGPGAAQRGEEGQGGLGAGRPASSNTSLSGTADTGGNRTFSPKAERYLDAGDPATLAARAEGELRGRLDALRRTIGTINRMAGQAEKKRLGAFVTWWNQRDNELAAFIRQIEDRAAQRDQAGRAEEAAWQPRVDRALEDARTDLEVKVRRMFADEMRFGYLETDAATRRMTVHGTQPGTFTGELLRTMMQFKAFPIAFTQRVLGRAIYGFSREERLTQGAHIGQLIVTTSLLGVLAMTLKDLLAGREPRDLTRPQSLLAGLAQGGGLGIFGDFLFAQASRSGNSPIENLVGPLASTGGNLLSLFYEARDGNPRAGRILHQIITAVPGNNLWYAKLGLDLLILNELREQVSPGFLARQDRNRQRDFGQGRWAPASIWD